MRTGESLRLPECRELISSREIQDRVIELADQISADYRETNPVLITLLKGAFIFLADLVRHLTIPHEIDFITLSSYRDGMKRSEVIEVINHLRCDVGGRDVLIVDEIVDTGRTLSQLIETLDSSRIKSLRVCTLLDKPSARELEVPIHYTGFEIPDVFVVGYGLDYRERFRNLPFIAELS